MELNQRLALSWSSATCTRNNGLLRGPAVDGTSPTPLKFQQAKTTRRCGPWVKSNRAWEMQKAPQDMLQGNPNDACSIFVCSRGACWEVTGASKSQVGWVQTTDYHIKCEGENLEHRNGTSGCKSLPFSLPTFLHKMPEIWTMTQLDNKPTASLSAVYY